MKKAQGVGYRIYGAQPISVVVLHGGPGGIGEIAPLAKRISSFCGVLEPFQKQTSINDELLYLASLFKKKANPPLILIGHSFGAWMACLFATQFPTLVQKLILIGTPPFEEQYVSSIRKTRLARMSESEMEERHTLEKQLSDPMIVEKSAIFERLGKLFRKIDSFDPSEEENEDSLAADFTVYECVWPEAQVMRSSGALLQILKKLQCPVVAIHGEYDPHPIEGAFLPLFHNVSCFRGIALRECGHTPWIERKARDKLYELLQEEIQSL